MGSGVSTGQPRNACILSSFGQCRGCRKPEKEKIYPQTEIVNTTKTMSRYPKKSNETTHVSSSDFPYFKPKVVTVRPRPVEKGTPQPINVMRTDDINNVHGTQFLLYNERYPIFNTDRKDSYDSRSHKSYKYVNDRRWSVTSVVPANITVQSENILLHKTVAELRESNRPMPYGRRYSYACDLEPDYYSLSINGSGRPSTPTPTDWYPAQRSNDYLVASSLLAVEQQRDRLNNYR